MIRVGLTGGIGAGKSTAAAALVRRGGYHIDADVLAREVVAPGTAGLAKLVDAFGPGILDATGALNRPELAARAFVDDEHRLLLNSITHPLVGARTQELLSAAPEDAIVIQDIPLLVENHTAPFFHLVVIIGVDADERLRRLTQIRGMAADDARARIAAQATDEQRRAVADVWLDNSGTPEELAAATDKVWDERLLPFESNVRSRSVVRTPLTLADPDPQWADAGSRLVNRLWALVGANAIAVDHIGSTAVPGLIAKPTLDIQITVTDFGVADSLADVLADGGFPRIASVVSDNPKPNPVTGAVDARAWEKRFHGSADPGRPANIHLRAVNSPGQRFALDFRDWLRADSAARAEYADVKRAALASSAGDGERYATVKEPWFDAAYERVARWRGNSGR
ncbi:MAG: dephospho-CoA kinase [Gordonia sp. (in: high G+C Gram-positive bacteria)]